MPSLSSLFAKLLKKARCSALKDTSIHFSSAVCSGSSLANVTMAQHSFCGYDCVIANCVIGPFCSIGSNVTIGGVAHPMQFVSTSPVFLSHKDSVKAKFARHTYLPEIVSNIGADVWIADGVYIKAGVNIGHGAVVGMGAVVTRDVPPYGIVAGNPARLIKYRFEDALIERLLASKWWELPEDTLRNFGSYFNDPIEFLSHINSK